MSIVNVVEVESVQLVGLNYGTLRWTMVLSALMASKTW